jgi:hypothetical protein
MRADERYIKPVKREIPAANFIMRIRTAFETQGATPESGGC